MPRLNLSEVTRNIANATAHECKWCQEPIEENESECDRCQEYFYDMSMDSYTDEDYNRDEYFDILEQEERALRDDKFWNDIWEDI